MSAVSKMWLLGWPAGRVRERRAGDGALESGTPRRREAIARLAERAHGARTDAEQTLGVDA